MILTVTPNPLLDYILLHDDIPGPGGKRVEKIDCTVGGKGLNVARMLKTLGRPAYALTFAGGANGEKIANILKQQGISNSLIRTISETRAGINLVVKKPLYHTWWIEKGSELENNEVQSFIEAIFENSGKASFVAMSGTIPGKKHSDLYKKILEVLKDFKGEIYLDARGVPLKLACEAGGFFLKHNRDEAIETFALDPFNPKEQTEFFIQLKRFKVWSALITNGKSDSLYWDGNKLNVFSSASSNVLSTVGCGDATLAGLLYGRVQGWSFSDSVRWGLAAGSADSEKAGPCEADYESVNSRFTQIELIESAEIME
ncbi:MAG: 1-phosphofructokinase family hexose kinase [Candidatus Rifleibacteriota bacterium]